MGRRRYPGTGAGSTTRSSARRAVATPGVARTRHARNVVPLRNTTPSRTARRWVCRPTWLGRSTGCETCADAAGTENPRQDPEATHVHRPYGRRNPADPADRRLARPGMRAVPGVVRRASAFVTCAGWRRARADRDRRTVHVRELRARRNPWDRLPGLVGVYERCSGARDSRRRHGNVLCLLGARPLCRHARLEVHGRRPALHGAGIAEPALPGGRGSGARGRRHGLEHRAGRERQLGSAIAVAHAFLIADNEIGNLAIDPRNHVIYQVFSGIANATEALLPSSFHAVWIAVSPDGGQTFTDKPVYVNPNTSVSYGHQFVNVSVDRAGTVYVVYTDNHNLFYSFSTDGGGTWTGPIQVNQPPSATAVMPWSVACDPGQLNIVWYGTSFYDGTTAPDNYPASAAWYVFFAQNLNAAATGSTFTQAAATPIIHYGGVCESGGGCTGNRDL